MIWRSGEEGREVAEGHPSVRIVAGGGKGEAEALPVEAQDEVLEVTEALATTLAGAVMVTASVAVHPELSVTIKV